MTDILLYDVPSALIASLLLVSTTTLFIMGLQSMLAGVRKATKPRGVFDSLYFRIGLMYIIDTLVYALTSVRLLRGPGVVDLWVAIVLSLVIVAPILVLDALAREAAEKDNVVKRHKIEIEEGCDCDC